MLIREMWLHGEKFEIDDENKLMKFEIREPWMAAGKTFGWLGNTLGLGLNKDALIYCLQNHLKIRLTVAGNKHEWETSPVDWLNFAHEYNAIMKKGNAVIYVVQWASHIFTKIEH